MSTAPPRITERDAVDAAANIIWGLHDQLRVAHGENLQLRVLLDEHGVTAPPPAGVVTVDRLRRLEDVMDLAREFLFAGSDTARAELWEAIQLAGRAP